MALAPIREKRAWAGRTAALKPSVSGLVGFAVGFGLRALAILRHWSLPPVRARTD